MFGWLSRASTSFSTFIVLTLFARMTRSFWITFVANFTPVALNVVNMTYNTRICRIFPMVKIWYCWKKKNLPHHRHLFPALVRIQNRPLYTLASFSFSLRFPAVLTFFVNVQARIQTTKCCTKKQKKHKKKTSVGQLIILLCHGLQCQEMAFTTLKFQSD